MFVPVTEIAPDTATVFRSIMKPLTVRLVSLVVPPTAPCRVTAPPSSASRSSDCDPAVAAFTVEVNAMSPSVPSSSLSLSTLTLACRSTGPVKVMSPSSLS